MQWGTQCPVYYKPLLYTEVPLLIYRERAAIEQPPVHVPAALGCVATGLLSARGLEGAARISATESKGEGREVRGGSSATETVELWGWREGR